MKTAQPTDQTASQSARNIAIVRILFGLVWLIDAAFKFQPAFYRGIFNTVTAADAGEPSWLNPWFHMWYRLIGGAPHFFAIVVIIIESMLALSLLAGLSRRITYIGGAVFSLLIWAVAEGFGGPYVAGATDIGAGAIYVLVFVLLYVSDTAAVPALSIAPLFTKLSGRFHRTQSVASFNTELIKADS